MDVPYRRPVGRPKAKGIDMIKKDIMKLKISEDETQNREFWSSI